MLFSFEHSCHLSAHQLMKTYSKHQSMSRLSFYLLQYMKESLLASGRMWHLAYTLTVILLNWNMSRLCKQWRSRSVGFFGNWSGSPLFVTEYVNLFQQPDQANPLADVYKWAWHLNFYNMTSVNSAADVFQSVYSWSQCYRNEIC